MHKRAVTHGSLERQGMATKLQYILFYGTTADAVCGASRSLGFGQSRLQLAAGSPDTFLKVYTEHNNWVVAESGESSTVDLDNEWELAKLREYYLFVSKVLWCPGFFVFIADFGYWGY